jgi:hypothetical protein
MAGVIASKPAKVRIVRILTVSVKESNDVT